MASISPRLLVAGYALVLAGCASSAGLQSEGKLRDPARLQATQVFAGKALTPAPWPSPRWWTAFDDPQLDALIEEALASAPSLDAAEARIRKARAQAGLADAARKPQLGGNAQVLGMQLPETLAGNEIGGDFKVANLLMLNFAWSPDFSGVARSKWQAAVGAAHAAEADANAVRLALITNVARSYVALGEAFDALDNAEAERVRSEALVTLDRQRLTAGLDNGIALQHDIAAMAGAQQQVQAAHQDISRLRNTLAALLGTGPDRGLEISRPRLHTPDLAIPQEIPSGLLARRPDLVAARWRVEASQHGIDASRAAFYPTINLSAIVGVASGHLDDLFGNNALLLNGGPALHLPLFEGGRLAQQLRASNADYDLAVAQYNQTLLQALAEVADALQAGRALEARIESTQQAHDAALRARAHLAKRLQAGLGTRLDVLKAGQAILQLERQLHALQAARRMARIDLDHALGGGIAPPATNTPAASAQALN